MATDSTTETFNPYPGLRPFRSDEDYLFFGREDQVAELLGILGSHRFVAVVGTSGSGKSSLVRCGLLSELQGGTMVRAGSRWDIAVMQPGGNPLRRLARALCAADLYDDEDPSTIPQILATLTRSRNGLVEAARQSELESGSNLLLVVDQFEEIFRFHEVGKQGQEQAPDFIRLLLTAVQQTEVPIYVVLTMRSDFLGDCSQFVGLAEAVNEGEYLIPRLTRDQSRAAIEGPARVAGGEISRRLVQRLLNDLGSETEQLPVLQHALMRTWDRWLADHESGEPVDFRHYDAVGGMQEALSRHADEVLDSLPDSEDRRVAEKIFKALTEKGNDGRGIRRPTRVESLSGIAGAEPDSVARVVDAYRRPGVTLLMPGLDVELRPETVVDISHESLMRVWQRLRSWVEDESQSVRIFRRLAETASLWKAGRAGLYHDPDLQIARTWRDETQPNEAWAAQYGGGFDVAVEFLEASREAAEAGERAREAARKRELEQAQRLAATQQAAARTFKRFSAAMVVVAVLAFGAMVYALLAHREAELAREEVAHSLSVADMIRGSELVDRSDSLRGLSFLLRSHELDSGADAALQGAFNVLMARRVPVPVTEFSTGGAPIQASEMKGSLLAVGDRQGIVRVWNVETGALLCTLQHPEDAPVVDLSFGDDGSLLAALSETRVTRIWRWESSEEMATVRHPYRPISVTIELVGSRPYLAAQLDFPESRWMQVRDVPGETADFFRVSNGSAAEYGRFLVLPRGDSHELVVQTSATTLERQDVELRRGLVVVHPEPANGEGSADGEEGGTPEPISAFHASRDGSWLAVAEGGRVLVRRLDTSEPALLLGSFPGRVTDVRFGPDPRRLVACSDDGAVRLLSVPEGQVLASIPLRTPARTAWLGPSGRLLCTVSIDSRARLWSVETGESLVEPFFHLAPYGHDPFLADGARILVHPTSGRLQSLRTVGVPALPLLVPHPCGLNDLAWSPDGTHVATAGSSGGLWVWRAADGVRIAELSPPDPVISVGFSPDGRQLLAIDDRGGARVWKIDERTEGTRLEVPGRILSGEFGGDGKRIVATLEPGIVGVWSAETGRQIGPLLRHARPVLSATFGPRDASVIVGTDRATVVVWDLDTTTEMRRFGDDGAPVRVIQVGPLGERVAYVGADGLLRIVSSVTGEELLTDVRDVAEIEWADDGRRVLARCEDQAVRLVDAATGELVGNPVDPRHSVHAGHLHAPHGRVLTVSGTQARVWDGITGQPISAVLDHGEAHIADAQFGPAGIRVAVACDDGSLRIWQTGFPSNDRADARAVLDLTRAVLGEGEADSNVDRNAKHPFAAWYFADPRDQTLSPGQDVRLVDPFERPLVRSDVAALRWAVLADPTHARNRARLALLRLIPSQNALVHRSAERDLQEAVTRAPEDPEVWFLNAMAQDVLGHEEEARSSYERVRELERGELARVRARLDLFDFLGVSPRTEAGKVMVLDLLDRAVELTLTEPDAADRSADELRARRLEVLLAAGRYDDAKEDWERVRSSRTLPPERVEALLLRLLDAARVEFDALQGEERRKRELEFVAAFFLRWWAPICRGDTGEKWRLRDFFVGLPETRTPRVELVPRRATWRYLDDDSDPGPGWKEVDFDDSTWRSGPGRLGFPPRDGRETILSRYNAQGEQTTTFYFRHSFWLDEVPELPSFLFGILHDDGILVYVNGIQVVRSRMPSGEVTRETFATETVGGDTETTYTRFDPSLRGLRVGKNVIAAEVHQVNATSSDIGFDLELEAGLSVGEYFQACLDENRDAVFSWIEALAPAVEGVALADAARLTLMDSPDEEPGLGPEEWLARAHDLHVRWQLADALEAVDRAVALARAEVERAPQDASDPLRRAVYLRENIRDAIGGSRSSSDADPRGTIPAATALDVSPPFRCVELGPVYNASRYDRESWHSEVAPRRLDGLPCLFTSYDGVPYDARGVVQLNSGVYPAGMIDDRALDLNALFDKEYPDRVTIPIGQPAAAVHLLHGTIYGRVGTTDERAAEEDERASRVVARVVFHYADGGEASMPLEWGSDVVDWSNLDGLTDLRALAWVNESGNARLFEKTWRNPSPEKVLSHIELISERIEAAPFLMAVTLEGRKP